MNESERQFLALADECARIRADWEDAISMWHKRPSDELFARCTDLVHDLAVACAAMHAIVRHRHDASPPGLAQV